MRKLLTGFLRWLLLFTGLGVAGALLVPVFAYVAGKRLIGAYEGKRFHGLCRQHLIPPPAAAKRWPG